MNKYRTNKVINPKKIKGLVTHRKTTLSEGNFFIVSLRFSFSTSLFLDNTSNVYKNTY